MLDFRRAAISRPPTFDSNYQALAGVMLEAHGMSLRYTAAQYVWFFGAEADSAKLKQLQRPWEISAVDFALKLNVLAVCAVVLFVGAILLGAF